MFENKLKFKLVFVSFRYETIIVEKIITTNKIEPTMKFHGKQYQITINKPAYILKNVAYFYFDLIKGSQLNFQKIEPYLSPDDLDIVIGGKIIKELTRGVMDNKKEKLMLIIVGIIIGALFSGVICLIVMQKRIDEIYKNVLDETTIPVVPFVNTLLRRW